MSFWARLKSVAGGETPTTLTLPSGTTAIALNSSRDIYYLNATAAVTIDKVAGATSDPVLPGRRVTFIGAIGTSAITFTNYTATTVKGRIDTLAGDSAVVDDQCSLIITQHPTGAWVRTGGITL